MFGSCSEPIKANKIIRMELEILNIQSEQNSSTKEMTTYDWPISTRVRHPCELRIFPSWK